MLHSYHRFKEVFMNASQLDIHWEKIENCYLTENVEFKNKAHDLVVKRLGFKPDLRMSIDGELLLRRSFKKFENGEITRAIFDKQCDLFISTIRGMIKNHYPRTI